MQIRQSSSRRGSSSDCLGSGSVEPWPDHRLPPNDVEAAFPGVPRGCLLRKMRNMGLGKNLVRRMDSFVRGRKVIMSVDRQDREPPEVTTVFQQGSPISPVRFPIYIADIHKAVKIQVEDSRGISLSMT